MHIKISILILFFIAPLHQAFAQIVPKVKDTLKIDTLKEVTISTGYQKIPKERATGAFSTVSNKTFNQQVSTNILDRLEAVASGVSVNRVTGSKTQIMIRGLSTLEGPKAPLVVLDNFPYEGDLNNLNPNDVESITILKDAAAASIWGTRAGNGVIVITTKRARKDQKLSIDFNSSFSIGARPDLYKLKQMSSADYIDVEQLLFSKGFYNSSINADEHPALSPVVELLIRKTSATAEQQKNIDQQINQLKTIDVRSDFNRYFYNPSLNQQYALSLKGGSAYNAWLISAGYDHNKTSLDATYDRLNLRFNNNLNLLKDLNLATNMLYTLSHDASGKPGYGEISYNGNTLYPYAQFADQHGRPLAIPKEYSSSYLDALQIPGLVNWQYYPLVDDQYSSNKTTIQDLTFNTSLQYKLTEAFKASVQYQLERQSNNNNNLQSQAAFYTRNLLNLYSQIQDGVLVNNIPKGDILDLSGGENLSNQLRGQLNFDQTFGGHQLTVLAGAELRSVNDKSDRYRTYGYNPDNLGYGLADLTRTYPTLITGYDDFIPDTKALDGHKYHYVSVFGNAAYTYLNRYTLSGSIRRDASNLFGVSTNNKWKPLWSTGLAWTISNEAFYSSNFLSDLKLRLTYGFSGNTDPARSGVTTIYNQGNSAYTNAPFYSFDQYANPDLKWETISQLNTGIDFKLSSGRLSGSVDVYLKKGSDLYASVPLDYTAGVGFEIKKNAARIKGSGIDLVFSSLNTTGLIRWNSDLNFSYHKDQLSEYYLSSLQASNFISTSSPRISGITGNPIYAIYSYKWAGLDPQNGKPRGYLNGAVSEDYRAMTTTGSTINDLIYHGSALPLFYGSIGNTLTWKRFSFTARILFKLDYYFRKPTIDYNALYREGIGHSDYGKRWQKPGDEQFTNVPAAIYPLPSGMVNFYQNAEPFVLKGDHIRLQYVNLGYQIKNVNLYLNFSNLGILWRANKEGLDPDYAQNNTLTPPKTIAVGLRASL